MMNMKHVIVTVIVGSVAGIGVAGNVDPISENNPVIVFPPAKTRAEVKAELAQARAQGQLVSGDEVTYPPEARSTTRRTREEVRQEAYRATRIQQPLSLDYIGG
jgi:hypothetical protein